MSKNSKNIKLIDPKSPSKYDVERNNKICNDRYITGSKISDMPDFKKFLIDKFVSKPSRDCKFATQGLCHVGDYVLITSYDTTDRGNVLKNLGNMTIGAEDKDFKTRNSRIDIADYEGRTKRVYLDNKSHVGGIAYHEKSGKIFVSNDCDVNIYDVNDLATIEDGGTLLPKSSFNFSSRVDGNNASYLQIHEDNLYIGVFSESKNAPLIKYQLNSKGVPLAVKEYTVPYSKVQGMEILEYQGEEYFIFSTSYGRTNNSNLIFAKLNEKDEFETIKEMTIPCMAEQISFNQDGELGIVFESDCTYYVYAEREIGNVLYLDAKSVIEEYVKKQKEIKKISDSIKELLKNDSNIFSDRWF